MVVLIDDSLVLVAVRCKAMKDSIGDHGGEKKGESRISLLQQLYWLDLSRVR
jgi:hypothetical protein